MVDMFATAPVVMPLRGASEPVRVQVDTPTWVAVASTVLIAGAPAQLPAAPAAGTGLAVFAKAGKGRYTADANARAGIPPRDRQPV